MLLPPASSEQMAVKDYFKNSEHGNLILNSVAGSGKTTTALYMAAELPHKNMLVLTYNAKLKLETREKAALLTLRNLEAHSFHAFGVMYYDKRCYRDTVCNWMSLIIGWCFIIRVCCVGSGGSHSEQCASIAPAL